MYVCERMYSHFLNLIDDKKIAKMYFSNKDMSEFNNYRLQELKVCVKKADLRYNELLFLLSIVQFLGLKELIKKISFKLVNANKELKKCITDLDIFEDNLAYLIISNIIKLEDCEGLGFDIEYIKELMYAHKKQIKNPYVEYYYDEKTGRTARVAADGKLSILPYTPSVVRNKIGEQKSKKICL